ncbi:MAG: hypothetical protein JWR26_2959 [Pedosphaera sp.]|nr:hypothetical protein [Pedosphaera sp.]
MNNRLFLPLSLVSFALLAPRAVRADDAETNRLDRLGFAARLGFNMKAKFKTVGTLNLPPNARLTPDGRAYNYDNGYVFNDVSGSTDGRTWNWGYDNSASQVAGNAILLSRSSVGTDAASTGDMGDSIAPGFEFTYNHEFGMHGKLRYGLEAAFNFMNFSAEDNSTLVGTANRITDAYAFTPGTTPPQAPPAYQGTFNGPGFLIGNTPTSSTSTTITGGAVISGRRTFNADLWGFRLGPYVEFPVCQRLDLSLSAGLAAGLLNSTASWTETAVISGGGVATGSGNYHDVSLLWGGYVNANAAWQLSERWSAEGGVQLQSLGTFERNLGGRVVELDLSRSVFLTLKVGCKF